MKNFIFICVISILAFKGYACDLSELEINEDFMEWTSVVHELKVQLESGDYESAYQLMSSGFRQLVPVEKFEEILKAKRISSFRALPLSSTDLTDVFSMSVYRFIYTWEGQAFEEDQVLFCIKEDGEWKFENLPIFSGFGLGGVPEKNNLSSGLYGNNLN